MSFNCEETTLPDRPSISITRVSFSRTNNLLEDINGAFVSGVFGVCIAGVSKSDSESSLSELIFV